MQAVAAKIPRALSHGSLIQTCDNSGAKTVKLISVLKLKTSKGRYPAAGVGDMILASVKKGKPDMRKKVVFAIVVRQRKAFRRPDGTRVKFEDNAVVVLKDNKGNPKGTIFKGPIAKEAAKRWPAVAKVASIII
ncbi:MAG: 50S ribosomal protein L14 [Candidatus Woesearchaeota archaeon]